MDRRCTGESAACTDRLPNRAEESPHEWARAVRRRVHRFVKSKGERQVQAAAGSKRIHRGQASGDDPAEATPGIGQVRGAGRRLLTSYLEGPRTEPIRFFVASLHIQEEAVSSLLFLGT